MNDNDETLDMENVIKFSQARFLKTFEVFPYSGYLYFYKDKTKKGKAIGAILYLYIPLSKGYL